MAEPRTPAPVQKPVGLTIAGSDSGGGAGIQADVKTMEAHGVFATTVLTSVTAQHTRGVESTHPVPLTEIEAQIDAVRSDFDLGAVKTGMLGVREVVEAVAETAADMNQPFVVDPVMVAASGDRLLEPDAEAAYEDLVSEATVVTPNADEAAVLTGRDISNREDMRGAGQTLLDMGARAVLLKGGHVEGEDPGQVSDLLVTEDDEFRFDHPRVATDATHGSGCTLSSAIAARLAHGDELVDAVEAGVAFMARAIRYPLKVGQGPGSVHHLVALRERASRQPVQEAVEGVVQTLVEANAGPLVPEVGMNVVGATPFAERPEETTAVEGRITRTETGIRPNRGTRYGASSHVARFLLATREHDPTLQFAANVRFDPTIESALSSLDGPVVEIDRSNEADPDHEGSTMGWAARRAIEQANETPVAVFDRGDVGKEPMTRLLARDEQTLASRATTLLEAI